VQDVDYALIGMEEKLFSSAEVGSSPDPRSLVNAHVVVSPGAKSLQEVAEGLKRVLQFIAYAHFFAASVEWYREATVLRFVTIISGEQFYVTGTVTASGPGYPELVATFQRDFDHIGPLQSLLKTERDYGDKSTH
jgi:hypothetical protein